MKDNTESSKESVNPVDVSVVIPSYEREQVLLETINGLLTQNPRPSEILIIDQSDSHDAKTTDQLTDWDSSGRISWVKYSPPSITRAMNHGLTLARNAIVLFLDDDVVPSPDLILQHAKMYEIKSDLWAVVGQVIQPWQQPEAIEAPRRLKGLRSDFDFPFHSTLPATNLKNVMAGNLSVKREWALQVGGFDENFFGSAYRFETEFARRIVSAGGVISFCPESSIEHLRVPSGGTRATGDHRKSASPIHGVGDYYFAMRQGWSVETCRYIATRMVREVSTKFHLKHPWYIPVKLVGEMRAFFQAFFLARLPQGISSSEKNRS